MTDILSTQTEASLIHDAQIDNLYEKHYNSRKNINAVKQEAENLNRKIPIEILALEWFTKLDSSAETKAYLLENFLPVLVLGCEKVLIEAQKKKLIDNNETDANFNPINRLAQFLIRNNPRHNSNNETSPYVRTTREVYQQLRDQLYILQKNKLATIKEDVRKRRTERERQEKAQLLELSKRKSQIEALFDKFNVPTNGRLELSLVMECFKFYKKYLTTLSDAQRKKCSIKSSLPSFCYYRDELNLTKRMMKTEFVETLLFVTEDLENQEFDFFSDFIEQCSIYFVNLANTNKFSNILHNLTIMLDSTNTGLLSRRRIIKLLKDFKEKDLEVSVRNPLEWPVIDPFIKFENKLEQLIPDKKMSANFSKSFLMSEISINQIPEKESMQKMNEENQGDVEQSVILNEKVETGPEEERTVEELDKPTEVVDENVIDPNQQGDIQKSFQKEESIINDAKPNSSNLNEIIQSNLSREEELLFMKGGVLYYTPVKKSFNIDLLKELDDDIINNSELQSKFDPEFLNSKQFRNLIHNYVTNNFMHSEIYVNDLVVYLKDKYAESRFEKNSKLDKNRKLKQDIYRSKKYSSCFEKLDNEGSGQLDLSVIENALQDFKDGLFREQIANTINLTRSEISIDGKSNDIINKNEFFDLISVLVGLVDFPKFEDQILNYLSCLYSYDVNEKTRGEVRKKWLNQIKYVGDITCGSFDPLYKQLFFTLFKDAENHGMKNNISAYISVLENLSENEIGLKCIASTPHDSKYILGKTLTNKDKCISFEVIDTSRPQHITSVRASENIHFFNESNKNDGSLVVFPLKYARNKVFGTIGIDTLQNTNKNSVFADHEISFYQGIANTFAVAYAHIIFKNRLIKACQSAIEWLKIKCKGIDDMNVYFVQMLENESNITGGDEINQNLTNEKYTLSLKPIIKYSSKNGKISNVLNDSGHLTEEVLEKKSGSRVYECALISETTVENFNGKVSYFVPLRNEEHKTVFVLEISSEEYCKNSEKYQTELSQIEALLYVLHKSQEELLDAHFLGISSSRYEFEILNNQDKFDIVFEKSFINFICEKLKENINNPIDDSDETQEIKDVIKLISDLTGCSDFVEKKIIDEILIEKMQSLDSTAKDFEFPQSSYNLSDQESLKKLHSDYASMDDSKPLIKLLVDYVQLISDLRSKSKLNSKN
ncbi:unnamed protein product [Brachionus calyciflorus]|uniref:EF-hand domain-containing protein n=1 Tax=Brachionus calyciflorus TaxID=104777 RepID=A0A813M136_9BILA|nr:unnamed protein product [Brachionus calyciflorus]